MSEPDPRFPSSGPSMLSRLRVEAHALWLAARDPRTPRLARILGPVIAAYALSPIDLIPDFIPILGLVDDAVLIPAGIWLLTRMIPAALLAEHRAAARIAAERPVSRWGALLVIFVWLGAALLCVAALRWHYL